MRIFITGGAGFIGINCADHFLNQGHEVELYDNLSRVGADLNLDWLHERHGERVRFILGDVREYNHIQKSISGANAVLHLASQVAVTRSVENPREDFEINAVGTFNLLEAVRSSCPEAAVLYASTNKVYGGMEGLSLVERETRYDYADFTQGIPENFPLDFHSPYGCSKGAGDQYTLDYARIYGLKTLVLRQSCIYGPRQFGVEDQGWLAHFIIAAVLGRPITIYGDGKQLRDVLHVKDLIRAYELGIQHINDLTGIPINLGGGPQNTLAIWAEFGPILESLFGRGIEISNEPWRPGDQRVYYSSVQRAESKLGWRPTIDLKDGIRDLWQWVTKNRALFEHR